MKFFYLIVGGLAAYRLSLAHIEEDGRHTFSADFANFSRKLLREGRVIL